MRVSFAKRVGFGVGILIFLILTCAAIKILLTPLPSSSPIMPPASRPDEVTSLDWGSASPTLTPGRIGQGDEQRDTSGLMLPTAPEFYAGGAPTPSPTPSAAGTKKSSYDPAGIPNPKIDVKADELLAQAGGPKDAKESYQVGGSFDLFGNLLLRLGKHPALVGLVVNNKYVVKGFMSRHTTRKTCSSKTAFKDYLLDTQSPKGISKGLPLLRKLYNGHEDMPAVLSQSKLVASILECPSIGGLVNDKAAVQEVAIGNPAVVMALTEPAAIKGIMASGNSSAVFGQLQASGGLAP